MWCNWGFLSAKKLTKMVLLRIGINILVIWLLVIFVGGLVYLKLFSTTTERIIIQPNENNHQYRRFVRTGHFSGFHSSLLPLLSEIYPRGFSEIGRNVCPKDGLDLKLLILITSAPDHFQQRLDIRHTWGTIAIKTDYSLGFLIGSSLNNSVADRLFREQKRYGDLVRGQFHDSYDTLTLKIANLFEFVHMKCSKSQFVLKTDDDVFINPYKLDGLVMFLLTYDRGTRKFYGKLASRFKVVRNLCSKYYVSFDEYPVPIYPDFITGPAYLFSTNIAKFIYDHALNQSFFRLEDVFFTGFVASSVGIKRQNNNEFVNNRFRFNTDNLKAVLTIHPVNPNEQYLLWQVLNQ